MNDLDATARRFARLQERFVSAVVFSAAAAATSLAVPSERRLMLFVALGAAGWVAIELTRLRRAGDDRLEALDRLILAGSSDPRCERRRARLQSPRSPARRGTDAAADLHTVAQSHCRDRLAAWLAHRASS